MALLLLQIAWIPQSFALGWGQEYIVVAWDEEFASHQFWYYTWVGSALPVNARQVVDWQFRRALYWFHGRFGTYVQFSVIGYVTWDSDDSAWTADLLLEAIDETGFNNGLYFNGVRATVLVAWTAQDNDNLGGGTLPADSAIIIKLQNEFFDDNTLMHELSHFYIAEPPADTPHGDCIMSSEPKYFDYYWEQLEPDSNIDLLTTPFQTQDWAYWSNQWCPQCAAIMIATMTAVYDPPADPWIEELRNDPTRATLFMIGFMLSIVAIAYLVIRISDKFSKRRKILANNKSSFFVANLFFPMHLASLIFASRPQSENIITPQHYPNITTHQQIQILQLNATIR